MDHRKLRLIIVLIVIMIASIAAYTITGSVFPLIFGSVVSVLLFSTHMRSSKH